MKEEKWEYWLPGVLSKEQVKVLIDKEVIFNTSDHEGAIDYSSLDLHLSNEAYHMKEGSIKPGGDSFSSYLSNSKYATRLQAKDDLFRLESGKTYVFRIKEQLGCSIKGSGIFAQATAKSSIGRMDIIARLIVDGMYEYEYMDPRLVNSGFMYLEVTPITFNISVKADISLSQIRFFKGPPDQCQMSSESISKIVLREGYNSRGSDGTLSVNLENVMISRERVAAFQAKGVRDKNKEYLEIAESGKYKPNRYWEKKASELVNNKPRLKIEKDRFYILRSKERINLPGGVAVYCKAMDESLGEMRIHYAGFVHPFFGSGRKDRKPGTPLIFEVRGHNVAINLLDNEKLAKLIFYRMSKDCIAPQDDDLNVHYNNQELKLSKFFTNWNDN